MIITQDTSHFFENYELVFVTGHPRSGTTISYAMICSSDTVNDFIPESSFLTGLVSNFVAGYNNDVHNNEFFGGKQAFVDYAGKQIRNFVNDCWIRFSSPKVLAFKDPIMMSQLDVFRVIFPRAKFVIMVRDPKEVVSSFYSVKRKEGVEITLQLTEVLARNAAMDYARTIAFKNKNPDNILLLHYDSFFDGSYGETITAAIPAIRCNPEKTWESKFVDDVQKKKTAWVTDKLGKKLDEVEKTKVNLSIEQGEIVDRIAGPEYQKVMQIL
ncbi:sulfotransferase family protein [Thalassospira alkalitolerans]|uniref:sulfotransferase family protein n=1 Tax=Thalassospira alkalitolerans TaxID=1293890 RepID=UPI003AA8295A